MKIHHLHLKNIGRFDDAYLSFTKDEKMCHHIIIIGNNGAGKTTILESIVKALSWFTARIGTGKGNGKPIEELLIKNSSYIANIEIKVEQDAKNYQWSISKIRKGRKDSISSQLKELNELTNQFRENFTLNQFANFPVLVYYNAHRSVLDIPIRIRKKHQFEQLNGYDKSLDGLIDYRTFFEWFREKEDIENEAKARLVTNNQINLFSDKEKLAQGLKDSKDYQLEAVRKALETFLPEIKNIRVSRKPRIHLAVDKNGEELDIEQLSQGEKLLMAMVGDIARRLAIMNPKSENPLLGNGIVLIDEAELHLHPKWQRNLLGRLSATFPNVQFIYTTHSPLIVSDFKDALIYSLEDGDLEELAEVYGSDVNQVLASFMDTNPLADKPYEILKKFKNTISNKDFKGAKEQFSLLENIYNDAHIELIKARLLLSKLKLRNEKNN